MLSDQELNAMLERSLQAGKATKSSQEAIDIDRLEKQYNQLIHGMIGIHQHYIRGIDAMQHEIEIVRECFATLSAKFMR